ncbi:DUF6894 family protein [Bradyrhizobium sp. PMVTL-01]|uniref:DUF6894 family protein n=1 Tax=Bradyrhizobium sp. PMVTL-01 TaxID=3434999 RepID=UPI003F6F19B8
MLSIGYGATDTLTEMTGAALLPLVYIAMMARRYFFHIRDGNFVSVDDEGMEFATPREANIYAARVAFEIGTDDRDYEDTELSVVDVHGHEIGRHRIRRQLSN